MALTPVTRPSDAHVARMRKVAEAYDAWAEKVIPDAPFHPAGHPAGSVYNLHFQDVESTGEQEDQLAEASP